MWKRERERVIFWTDLAVSRIKEVGSLEFAPLFFRILKEEKGNLSIAVRTAHRLLKHCLKDDGLEVQIDKQKYSEKDFPTIALWKMEIRMQ